MMFKQKLMLVMMPITEKEARIFIKVLKKYPNSKELAAVKSATWFYFKELFLNAED